MLARPSKGGTMIPVPQGLRKLVALSVQRVRGRVGIRALAAGPALLPTSTRRVSLPITGCHLPSSPPTGSSSPSFPVDRTHDIPSSWELCSSSVQGAPPPQVIGPLEPDLCAPSQRREYGVGRGCLSHGSNDSSSWFRGAFLAPAP